MRTQCGAPEHRHSVADAIWFPVFCGETEALVELLKLAGAEIWAKDAARTHRLAITATLVIEAPDVVKGEMP